MLKKSIAALLINVTLLLTVLGGCNSKVAPDGQSFEVKRGNLDIVVSTNGSLAMPNSFDLRFGTTGKVQDILVKEGDKVKQGAILAFLDSTAQRNAIRTALFNIRTAANNIVVACNAEDLPNSYPDLSTTQMYEEAQNDLDECIGYFQKGLYRDAGFKLGMTYFDIEVCEDIIKSKLDPVVLAGAKSNSIYYLDGTAGTNGYISSNDAMAVEQLQEFQKSLMNLSQLIVQGAYQEVISELDMVKQEMLKNKQLVENTVRLRGRSYLQYPDIPTSLNFLQSSLRSLQNLDEYMAQGDTTLEEIARKIYTAKTNLSIGSDILENQTLTYDWNGGSNWKILQQYNLNVQSTEIALYKAKRDIMNTVIIAPSDGTVVSVDLKKGYVLSAQDYSSRTAIKLVDTTTMKFTGLVDEIDIMKVKSGQKARITVDAVPGKIFTGTVRFISPFGVKTGQVVKFTVTIEMDPSDVELRGGLSATADINIYSARNVLLVPISALSVTPSGATVTVWNEVTGQTESRKVTLGERNFQYAEVVSGLKEGEKVLGANVGVNPGNAPRGAAMIHP